MYVYEAIHAFRADQETLGLAPNTLSGQASNLRKLAKAEAEWTRENGKRSPMKVSEIDARLVTLFFARCVGGQGNRNNMTSFLRNFVRFCEMSGWLEPGTCDRLLARRKMGTYQRQPKHYVEADRFAELLDCQDRHPADRAAMALLLYTLCRRSELVALKIKDVDLAGRTLKVWREKTDRWTDVGICPELHQELSIWLFAYSQLAASDRRGILDPEWYLLPRLTPIRNRGQYGTYEGKASYVLEPNAQPRHMERIVKRGLDAIGVKTTKQGTSVNHMGEGAHTIRRSGARAMLKHLSRELGYADALVTVSAMLDHQDVRVTLRYIGMERQKEELNDWLRTSSPYGSTRSMRTNATPTRLMP